MKKHRFRDLGINQKFLWSICLILILPQTLMLLFINTSVAGNLRTQAARTVLETLKQAQTPLSTIVSDADYLSKEILSDNAVQEYLRRCLESPTEELFAYRYPVDLYLSQLLDSRSYILRAALFSGEEMVLQSGAYLQEDSLPADCDPQQLAVSRLEWGTVEDNQRYLSRYERGYEVTLLRAVNDLDRLGVMLGVEKLTIREAELRALYETVAGPNTEQLFLINDDAAVVSALDSGLLEQKTIDPALSAEILGRSEGYFFTPEDKLVCYFHMQDPGWYLVRIDTAVSVASGGLLIVFSIVLTLLFAVVFIVIQRRNIIRPIVELSEEVRSFHDGNYTFTTRRSGSDEIGLLNQACVEMGAYIQDLIERVYKSQLAEKESQLKQLQAQINPHFLYNTLETIRWMALRNKQPDIAQLAEALARLFKHALNDGREMTTVREELEHLKSYTIIQKSRFGDRITVTVSAEPEALSCRVLNLLLQPLVENAFVHGLEGKLGQGHVQVTIAVRSGVLTYTVADDGLGTDPAPVRQALENAAEDVDQCLALRNIHLRLRYKYGPDFGVTFESAPGQGTVVTAVMPAERGESDDAPADCG